MRPIFVVLIAVAAILVLCVAAAFGAAVFLIGRDVGQKTGVVRALERHSDELHAIPGVQSIGTHMTPDEPSHIVVWVHKVTPEIRAAVPATLDGYRVDVEQETALPTEPPVLQGVIESATPATPEQTAAGLAGIIVVKGELYKRGMSVSKPLRRTLTVRVPTSVQIWRPMGEGKDFIDLAAILVGDTSQVTLTAIPAADQHTATATDVEAYTRM
jgi:hypothetical protein